MFCIRCGKQLPDEPNFCPFCGTDLRPTLQVMKEVRASRTQQKVVQIAEDIETVNLGVRKRIDNTGAAIGAEIDQALSQAEQSVNAGVQTAEQSVVNTVNDVTNGVKSAVTDAVESLKDPFGNKNGSSDAS
ncbi:MAG: zinc ribbon domain-containing protein [Lachnospiraceae bacterium]|nr:zinc ribbon domain-containing protein [Lachnospiraceae bacterium]